MAQSGEQFAGEEEGSDSKEDSMSPCRMNKLVAPVNLEVDGKHYQLQQHGTGKENDANQKERLLDSDNGDSDTDVNEGCQLGDGYKRDLCQGRSCHNAPYKSANNEANGRRSLFNGDCSSPIFTDSIKDDIYKSESETDNGKETSPKRGQSVTTKEEVFNCRDKFVLRKEKVSNSGVSSVESLSLCSTSPEKTPSGSCSASPLEEMKPGTAYDIQFDKQTNRDPQARPSSLPCTSQSIKGECLNAGPHYRHISRPTGRHGRSAANDIRDDDRLCSTDEREMEQIESVCNSIEKVQEKKETDWQLQIQKEKKQNLHSLQEYQGTHESRNTKCCTNEDNQCDPVTNRFNILFRLTFIYTFQS